MGKIDVFLSYEHSMKSVVDHICAALEQDGIRCWYAPRDVMGDYATSIMNAIDEARVFVVVLNNAASESVHVLNEVENAYKRIVEKNGDLTILPFRLSNEDLSKAMEYYINRLHWIDAASQGVDNAVAELKSKIKAILSPRSDASGAKRARTANPYFKDGDKKEKHRLAVQRELLKSFDAELYDKIAAETDTLTVLDLGSADGSFVMDRLGRRENLGALLGIDFDQSCVDAANSAYGSDKIEFRQGDLESDAVEDAIRAFLDEKGIAGFNVINLSMVLLHLQNPLKLLPEAVPTGRHDRNKPLPLTEEQTIHIELAPHQFCQHIGLQKFQGFIAGCGQLEKYGTVEERFAISVHGRDQIDHVLQIGLSSNRLLEILGAGAGHTVLVGCIVNDSFFLAGGNLPGIDSDGHAVHLSQVTEDSLLIGRGGVFPECPDTTAGVSAEEVIDLEVNDGRGNHIEEVFDIARVCRGCRTSFLSGFVHWIPPVCGRGRDPVPPYGRPGDYSHGQLTFL